MSTRELQREIAQLRQKNQEMQITMDQLLKDAKESPVEDMKQETERLREELNKQTQAAQQAARQGKDALKDAADARKEKDALEKALREQMKAQADEAKKDKEALEKALRDAGKPVIQQVTPPDVEKELADLRAKLNRSQEEQAMRAGYDVIRSSFGRLEEQLRAMASRDADLANKVRAAFAKGLRLMADGLEGADPHADQ
jgi:chromosome segregation ATPase